MIRLITAALPVLWVFATLIGLGLNLEVYPLLALFLAAVYTGLPILGLQALFPDRPLALPLAAWGMGLLILISLPLFFPGQSGQATARGTRALSFFLGNRASEALGETAEQFTRWASGEDRKPEPSSTPSRIGAIRAQRQIDSLKPPRDRKPAQDPQSDTGSEPITLTYDGDDRSLRIGVDIDGPDISELYTVILDTGATYSTLSEEALENLGIPISPDAPWVELQTAGGIIEAPLALVDAVWLGDFPVEWVTVAVCEACGRPPVAGLLGLNVLQRFRVSIDHEEKKIELFPRRVDSNRRVDIGHWLDIHGRITQSSNGKVDLELRGQNRARQAIRAAVINIDCSGTGFAVEIGDIPAGGEVHTQVDLPQGTDCRERELTLSRATWVEDRFDDL
ncbi:MAG: retropepsin-like aspartic protease [Myxococcota bacterium]|nr:retropepsin-like aspartic protease [Myxococcota bacterium]